MGRLINENKIMLSLVILCLSGCVTTSDHTAKSDLLIAENSKSIVRVWGAIESLPIEKPDYGVFRNISERVYADATEHAEKYSSFDLVGSVVSSANGLLNSPLSGPVGVAISGVIGMFAHSRTKKKLVGVIDKLTVEPDVQRCKDIRSGVV